MPFCNVTKTQNGGDGNGNEEQQHLNGIKIFYRRYGHGSTKVLLIIGLAGTHDSWGPQIMGLTGTDIPNDPDDSKIIHQEMNHDDDPETKITEGAEEEEEDGDVGIEVCAFDNRGVGRSSIPTKKTEYTTTIMAKDAIALMDHLGWKKAHVFGHSMGGMIACKLAALVPHRLLSLALLNATGGGFECFPKLDRQTLSVAMRFLKAKTPEQRAAVDLDTHYSKEYLDECVGTNTRRSILYQQYVKNISSTGMQSNHGFEGQLNACWTHKLTANEFDAIRSAGFLISIIHGRHDIIAQICYARRLAEKLQPSARMIDLHGGHLVSHERPTEVNMALLELINASELKWIPEDWSNLSKTDNDSQLIGLQIGLSRRYTEGSSRLSFMFEMLAKLHLSLLYLFGLFVMVFEYGRRLFRGLKPARVGISTS